MADNAGNPFAWIGQTLDTSTAKDFGRVDSKAPEKQTLSTLTPYQYDETDHMRALMHGSYSSLGYSALRNNDAIYNDYGSAFGDFNRALVGGAKMGAKGFSDSLPWNSFSSTSFDPESGDNYDELSKIYGSTRKGFTGFAGNLMLNSGYTMGILAEAALEEVALVGFELLTAGAGTPVVAARTGANIAKVGKGMKKAWTMLSSTGKALDKLKDINSVRQAIQGSYKGGKWVANQALDILSPNTVNYLKNAYKAGEVVKTGRVVGNIYRDAKQFSLAMSESALEGGMIYNNTLRELTKHKEEMLGRSLTEEERQEIEKIAKERGKSTYAWNLPAIVVSNSVLFNTITGSKALSKVGKNLSSEALEGIFKSGGKYGRGAQYLTKDISNLFNKEARGIAIQSLKNKGINFLGDNLTEGLQEGYQEVVSGWQENIAKEQYNNGYVASNYRGLLKSIDENLLSMRGLETIATGMLMSGPVAVVTSPFRYSSGVIKDYRASQKEAKGVTDSTESKFSTYRKYKKALREEQDVIVNKLNEALTTEEGKQLLFSTTMERLGRNISSGEKINSAETTEEHISEKAKGNTFDFMWHAENGTLGEVQKTLEEMSDMSVEEYAGFMDISLEDAQKANHVQNMKDAIEFSKEVEKNYEQITSSIPMGPDPSRLRGLAREKAMAFRQGRKAIIDAYVFNKTNFEDSLKRITELTKQMSSLTKAGDFSKLSTITSLKGIEEREAQIEEAIDTIKRLKIEDVSKEELTKLKKEAKLLKTLKDSKSETEIEKAFYDYLDLIDPAINSKYTSQEEAASRAEGVFGKSVRKDFNRATEERKKAFSLYKDTRSLDSSSSLMNYIVNSIIDGGARTKQLDYLEELGKSVMQSKEKAIREGIDEFYKDEELNTIVDAFKEMGIALDRNGVQEIKNGMFPSEIYEEDGDNIKPLSILSPKFQEVIKFLKEYNPKIQGIPITEFSGVSFYHQGEMSSNGEKISRANLKLEEITDLLGITINTPTTVNLANILELIKNSTLDPREAVLVEELLSGISKTTEIDVVYNQESPIKYDKATGRLSIDLRYVSSEYKFSDIANIGPASLFLRAAITLRIQEAYNNKETDSKSKAFIEEFQSIYDEAIKDPELSKLEMSLETFMLEALTNDQMQLKLASIESSTPSTSIWKKVLEAVSNFFSKLDIDNTLLNRAIENMAMLMSTDKAETVTNAADILSQLSQANPSSTTEEIPSNVKSDKLTIEKLEADNSLFQEKDNTFTDGVITLEKLGEKNLPITEDILNILESAGYTVVGQNMFLSGINKDTSKTHGYGSTLSILAEDKDGNLHAFQVTDKDASELSFINYILENKHGITLSSINTINFEEGITPLPVDQELASFYSLILKEDQTNAITNLKLELSNKKDIGENEVENGAKQEKEKEEDQKKNEEGLEMGEDLSIYLSDLKGNVNQNPYIEYNGEIYKVTRIVNGNKQKSVSLQDKNGKTMSVKGKDIFNINLASDLENKFDIKEQIDPIKETLENIPVITTEAFTSAKEVDDFFKNEFNKNNCQ